MPVGTAGTVKAARWSDVETAGAEIVLANTYHLMLRPGGDTIRRLGGLHRFAGWDRPILTDSGGYQVMSLAGSRTLSEEGVLFRSHVDGSPHALTPERAVDLQLGDFGVDVAMVLDECTPWPATKDVARTSMDAHASLGGARGGAARGARLPARRALRDRPGRDVSGPEGRERGRRRGASVRGNRVRRALRRRAQGRDAGDGRGDGAAPSRGEAAVPHGRRAARTTSSTRSRAASTSSTACCRPARRATASSTRPRGRSRSSTRATARTRRRPIADCGCRDVPAPLARVPEAPLRRSASPPRRRCSRSTTSRRSLT